MNKAFERWVANLESGQFQQGTGALSVIKLTSRSDDPGDLTIDDIARNGKHCCLGVACIDAVRHVIIRFKVLDGGVVRYGTNPDNFDSDGVNSNSGLPVAVSSYIGVDTSNASVITADSRDVINMNDTTLATFADIAAALRAGIPQNAISES